MRKSKADTAKTKAEIVAVAARLFRERGFDRVSVADIMGAAGLTHGGFYSHFRSKENLQAAAIGEAFREKLDALADAGAAFGDRNAVRRYLNGYLTQDHVRDLATGCPIAGLAIDATRSGPEASIALGTGARQTFEFIAAAFGASGGEEDRAIEVMSCAIGAIVLARSVTDPDLRQRIIDIVRRRIAELW